MRRVSFDEEGRQFVIGFNEDVEGFSPSSSVCCDNTLFQPGKYVACISDR